MSNKEHISDEELKREFPLLFSQKKGEDLEAPNGYFETLPSQVMQKIGADEGTKVIPIQRNKRLRSLAVLTAIAASFLIGVFFWGGETVLPKSKENFLVFTSMEIAEINEDIIADIDEDLIFEALLSDDMDQIEENEEYIDYIYENDIDIEEIIYEL